MSVDWLIFVLVAGSGLLALFYSCRNAILGDIVTIRVDDRKLIHALRVDLLRVYVKLAIKSTKTEQELRARVAEVLALIEKHI